MKILVVGGGGREHTIIRKLRENPRVKTVYAAPGNGGISADAQCVPIQAAEVDKMVAFAKGRHVDLAVVAPDDPLVLGMVDAMNAAGIATFGPTKAAARIEGSKIFSKELMRNYGIPTASYETFDDADAAVAYLNALDTYPIVIKADGLALGKGVVIAENFPAAEEAVRSMIEGGKFGQSGKHVVVEEFLTGPEVSVLAFCDGKTVVPMISSMDHKRANDHDEGLNTGGMGTVAPNIHYTPAIAEECMARIFRPTMEAMEAEGCPFSGCLYFGLMLTPNGPYVIEYNCRFGDPETQVVLPLLETDLLTIMEAINDHSLSELPIRFSEAHAACVVMASGGYPGPYETGYPIEGLDENGQISGATVYHAGTKRAENGYQTAGGRVLGVTCTSSTAEQAIRGAYKAVSNISFQNMHFRRDIGAKNSW